MNKLHKSDGQEIVANGLRYDGHHLVEVTPSVARAWWLVNVDNYSELLKTGGLVTDLVDGRAYVTLLGVPVVVSSQVNAPKLCVATSTAPDEFDPEDMFAHVLDR